MCEIVCYIRKKDPVSILLKGLRKLEYRRYDSAGVALLNGEKLQSIKKSWKSFCSLNVTKRTHSLFGAIKPMLITVE